MRRTALLLLTAFFPLLSIQVNAQTKRGDLNGDGNVGKEDVTCLIYKILGLAEGNDAYDVNEDGKTDIADVTCLIGIIAGSQQGSSFVSCPDDNHPHIIDLGLPSGTKWACCNVGALKPENYGGYYAWGETEVKDDYSWETYLYCDGTKETCHFLGDICGTEYDVAHVKMGGLWHMPNLVQMQELVENCTYEWITVNGVNGGKFTSKTNGNSIFIPADGSRVNTRLYDWGISGHYWSGTPLLDVDDYAGSILLTSGFLNWNNRFYRYRGLPVRPVISESITSPLRLSSSVVGLVKGEKESVEIITGSWMYSVQSSNESVATAAIQGNSVIVTAIGAGNATITVKDTRGGQTANINVTVIVSLANCPDDHHPHMIDLGLPSGIKWACCNVGSTLPEGYGGYYAWGETEAKNTYSWKTYQHCDGTKETCHYLGNITGTAYDVAHVKWGEAWRMPTIAERDELIKECSVETVTFYNKFYDKYTGPNGSFIIIPYGGDMYSSSNTDEGSDVYCWTSEQYENGQFAHYLYKKGLKGSCLTCMGLTVRPVYDPSFFFSLSEETVDVFVNSTTSVSIEMGSGEYELQYDQTDIIDAELIMADKEEDPDAKDEISIYGVAEGTATLSVLDKQNNKTATLVVNVKTPTEEDIATTMEYIARVRNYINSLGEISVDVFQSNLLSWLDEQNWVKKVSTYSDDLVPKTSPNGARSLIKGLNDRVGLIEITFENRANLFINFNDMALLGAVDTSGNLNLSSYLKSDVSSIKDEEIIENANVLYIQGRTMPNFKEQNKSTAEKEKNLIQQTKELSPIDFKITTVPKSLSFLDKEKTKIEDYSMILLGQTHGGYSDGSEYAGYFQVEDRLYAGKIANYAIDMIIDNKRAIVKSDDPDNNGAYVIYNVTPFAMKNLNIKEKTIFFGSYCHSYYMQEHIPNTTFFGYSTKENYYEGTGKMADFFRNMSLGMTYKDAIENKDPITNKPNPINKEYDYINEDDETVHVEPATNRPESKQRYFSISTEDVTEYSYGRPVITGTIKGYDNLKSGIIYYAYVFDKDEQLNPADITTKGQRMTINEDGTFQYIYSNIPIKSNSEIYNVVVGFSYGGITYYGEVKTFNKPGLYAIIDNITEDNGNYLITGKIKDYDTFNFPYFRGWAYVYVYKTNEDFNEEDVFNKGVKVDLNNDGSFTYTYLDLPEYPQEMSVAVGCIIWVGYVNNVLQEKFVLNGEKKTVLMKGFCPDIDHPHAIDIGAGVKWSCCDVGAKKPEDIGGYYAFGEIEEKNTYTEENYLYLYYTENGYRYEVLADGEISGTKYDVAHVKWGNGWRIPTTPEAKILTSIGNKYVIYHEGIRGLKITGTNGNSIFIPFLTNSTFRYWCSHNYGNQADLLYFNVSTLTIYPAGWKFYGYPVRPVKN